MKKFLILVNKKGGKPELFKSEFLKIAEDVEVVIEDYASAEFFFTNNSVAVTINSTAITDFDMVYLRSFEKFVDVATSISQVLIYNKIKVFDTLLVKNTLTDKLFQNVNFVLNGLAIPKSVYIPRVSLKEKINKVEAHIEYPFVMKSIYSNEGRNNFLVKSREELMKVLEENDSEFIFQEFIPNDFDYRIVVINFNEIKSVAKRVRQDNENEHRNNSKIGATEIFISANDLPEEIKQIAMKSARIMNTEIAGVDIVTNKVTGQNYMLEVNHTPGLTYNSIESETVFKFLLKSLQ